MDNRPIGVFDSGLGGLTAVSKLMEALPGEEIIYLGDTGRVPYGSRSRDTIIKYARQDIGFLRSFDIKAIVAACGTVSTTALETIEGDYDLPIFGVLKPAAAEAAERTKNGKIGLIGTQASIRSGAYDRAIHRLSPKAEVLGKACPLFVPLVENGRINPGDILIETVTDEYLATMRESGVDTLILGCTHYPLLHNIIGKYMGPEVTLISPGALAGYHLAETLKSRGMLSAPERTGGLSLYVSDSPEGFSELASLFLQKDVSSSIAQVDLECF